MHDVITLSDATSYDKQCSLYKQPDLRSSESSIVKDEEYESADINHLDG